jgi:hypothetical protein
MKMVFGMLWATVSGVEGDVLILVEQLKRYSVSQSVPIVLTGDRDNLFTLDEFSQMSFS